MKAICVQSDLKAFTVGKKYDYEGGLTPGAFISICQDDFVSDLDANDCHKAVYDTISKTYMLGHGSDYTAAFKRDDDTGILNDAREIAKNYGSAFIHVAENGSMEVLDPKVFSFTISQRPEGAIEPYRCIDEINRIIKMLETHNWKTENYTSPLAKRLAAAADNTIGCSLAEKLEKYRIAVTPEYEGGWHAELYGNKEYSVARSCAISLIPAVNNVIEQYEKANKL